MKKYYCNREIRRANKWFATLNVNSMDNFSFKYFNVNFEELTEEQITYIYLYRIGKFKKEKSRFITLYIQTSEGFYMDEIERVQNCLISLGSY
jgi:hypothetical protein